MDSVVPHPPASTMTRADPAQAADSACLCPWTRARTDRSTRTTDGMTGRGGPSGTSTEPVSVTATSAGITVEGVDTGGPEPTVTSGFLWVSV